MAFTRWLRTALISFTLISITSTTVEASIRSSLLIRYSASGNIPIVKLLLRIGANPNFLNRRYNMASIAHMNTDQGLRLQDKYITALIAAIKNDHIDIVKILLDAGANPNLPKSNDMSISGSSGDTALAVAVDYADNTSLIQMLLSKKADPNIPNSLGLTPLMHAIKKNHFNVVLLLLNAGADPNPKNRFGDTPLLLAVKQGNVKIIEMLLSKRVNLDCAKDAPECPLIQASRSGNEEIFEMLINAGADVNAINAHGQTAFTEAIARNNIHIARRLLEEGADPNYGSHNGDPPIIQATKNRNRKAIELLLNHHPSINFDGQDSSGNTALIIAYQNGYLDIFHNLLNRGANPSIQSKLGDTLLIMAYENKDLGTLYELLKAGADPNAQNKKGETVLKRIIYSDGRIHEIPPHIADVIQALLDAGASPIIEGDWGKLEIITEEKDRQKCIDALTKVPPLHLIGNRISS